jgi:hypothetical protein
MLPTPEGNYIGIGYTYVIGSNSKLIKFTANGDTVFAKKIPSFMTLNDNTQGLAITLDGGYIALGKVNNGVDGVQIVKFDTNGNEEWRETYNGGESSSEYGLIEELNSIIVTSDGGYLIGLSSNANKGNDKTEDCKGDADYWLIKTDATGLIEWDKTIGGNSYEARPYILQTADGGYVIAGSSASPSSGDKTQGTIGDIEWNLDFWLVKLDAAGNKIWDKTIGASGEDYVSIFQCTADGVFLLVGNTNSGKDYDKTDVAFGIEDFWILKLDALGNITWQKSVGGSWYDQPSCAVQLLDGSYIIGGQSGSPISGNKTVDSHSSADKNSNSYDYWVFKLSAAGEILWQTTVGGTAYEGRLQMIHPTAEGGFVLAGESTSSISGDRTVKQKGGCDIWFVKLGDAELPVSLISFAGTDFNGDAKLVWKTATEDNFKHFELEKQTALGQFVGLANILAKGNNSNYAYTDKLTAGANYYRLKMVDKDGSIAYSNIVKLQGGENLKLTIYPNPVTQNGRLMVNFPAASSQSFLQLITADGKLVSNQKIPIGATQVRLETVALAKGNYFFVYISGIEKITSRFVKH